MDGTWGQPGFCWCWCFRLRCCNLVLPFPHHQGWQPCRWWRSWSNSSRRQWALADGRLNPAASHQQMTCGSIGLWPRPPSIPSTTHHSWNQASNNALPSMLIFDTSWYACEKRSWTNWLRRSMPARTWPSFGGNNFHLTSPRSTTTRNTARSHRFQCSWSYLDNWVCRECRIWAKTWPLVSTCLARSRKGLAGFPEMTNGTASRWTWRPLRSTTAAILWKNSESVEWMMPGKQCLMNCNKNLTTVAWTAPLQHLPGGRWPRDPCQAENYNHYQPKLAAFPFASVCNRVTKRDAVKTSVAVATTWRSPSVTAHIIMMLPPLPPWLEPTPFPARCPGSGRKTSTGPTVNSRCEIRISACVSCRPRLVHWSFATLLCALAQHLLCGPSIGQPMLWPFLLDDCWASQLDTMLMTLWQWNLPLWPKAALTNSPSWQDSSACGWRSPKPFHHNQIRRS